MTNLKTRAMFPVVETLVRDIEQSLSRVVDLSEFSTIATCHLNQFIKHNRIDLYDVLKWSYFGALPKQPRLFGETPITLYYSEIFVIDLYVWQEADTDIHDHGFAGAFTVIDGEVLNISYQAGNSTQISDVKICDLRATDVCRLLPYEQVVTIEPGDTFIHKTVHLTNRSATLCVRTCDSFTPQNGYYSHGIVVPMKRSKNNYLSLSIVSVLRERDMPNMETLLCDVLQKHGLYTFVELLFAYGYQSDSVESVKKVLQVININLALRKLLLLQIDKEHKKRRLYKMIGQKMHGKIVAELFEIADNNITFDRYLAKLCDVNRDNSVKQAVKLARSWLESNKTISVV